MDLLSIMCVLNDYNEQNMNEGGFLKIQLTRDVLTPSSVRYMHTCTALRYKPAFIATW